MHHAHRYRCILAIVLALAAPAHAQSLQVLHWWKSASERAASEALSSAVRGAGIGWVDEDAGGGTGAAIVLRSRLLARDLPDVAQANSVTATYWAKLGLVQDLDTVAAAGHWQALLLPAIDQLIRPAGHVVAAPLGIHRLNTLFFPRRLFARLGLAPPQTWDDFERVAARLQRAGVVPLAQSSEPWQLTVLFESLLLAEADVTLHSRLFRQADEGAFADARVGAALRRMRGLKRWMRQPLRETDWTAVVHDLVNGRAAMTIAGDWVKGELNIAAAGQDFSCLAAPGTAKVHLYDIDTLAMLHSHKGPRAAQQKAAQLVVAPALQERYNRIKGSVSVLRDAKPEAMDSCALASWTLFASPGAQLVASGALGMSGEDVLFTALTNELHRFFMDDAVSVEDTQRRLAAASRAITRTRPQ